MTSSLAFFLLVVVIEAVGVQIDRISPNRLSKAGGTRLEIRGTGFSADRLQGSNQVYVGPFECSVIDHYTTDTVVVCETSPGDVGTYQVSVLVDGTSLGTYCCMDYDDGYSPSLRAVRPSAGPPGTQVNLIGDAPSRVQRDCGEEAAGPNDESCLGEVVFGDFLCDTGAGTDDASTVIDIKSGTGRFPGWQLYDVGCTLPDPSDSQGDMMPGLATAGNVNVSLHFEASLQGGMTVVELDTYQGTRKGDSYLFQLYAVVDSVSPSLGSVAGGTELTFQGRGFPDLSLGIGDTMDVEVAGSRCSVLSSNFTHLICETGPQLESHAPPTAIEGVWPGMRGLEMEVYMEAEDSVGRSLSNLGLLNDTITVENSGDQSFRTIETAIWETPLNVTADSDIVRWCSKSKAFFVAPVTGDFRFYMSAHDYGTLHGSWIKNGTETVTHERLIAQSSRSSIDDYWQRGEEQWSPLVFLEANQSILLDAAQCANPWGGGHLQLAVLIPSDVGTAQSLPEKQKLTVRGDSQARSQVLSYLSGTGTDDIVLNVTAITSLEYAWMLVQEYPATLTFKPSINGTNLGQDFNVSIIESEQSVREQLAQALGASTSEIGVLRYADVMTVIYQIGLEAAKFPGFSLEVEVTTREDPSAPFQLPPPPAVCVAPSPPLLPLPELDPTFPPESNLPLYPSAYPPVYPSTYPPVYPSTYPPVYSPMEPPAPPAEPPTEDPPPAVPPTVDPRNVLQATVTAVAVDADVVLGVDTFVTWRMGTAAAGTFEELAYNATRSEVQDTIRSLVGYGDCTSSTRGERVGGYIGHRWTIEWPWDQGNSVPQLLVSPGPETPPGHKITSELLTNASTPIRGLLEVGLGDSCDTVELDLVEDKPTVIAEKLANLQGLSGRPLKVWKSGDDRTGYDVTVHFDPVATAGNLPMMRVTSLEGVTGDNLRAQFTLQSNGSTSIFLGPIPTELLRLPVNTSDTLNVHINGVPTACTSPDGPGGCTFVYDESSTPRITNLSTTTLQFESDTTAELTITGEGFIAGSSRNRVMLDATPCNITAASTTSITCFITDDTPGGTRELSVYVDNLGFAAPDNQEVQVKTAFISDVNPKVLHANGEGTLYSTFTMVTIMGKGFDPNCARNALSIGGQMCGIVACDASSITALFPGNGTSADNLDVTVMVMDKRGEVRDLYTLADSGVHQREDEVASIAALLSPSQVQGTGTELTLQLGANTNSSSVSGLALWPDLNPAEMGDKYLASYKDLLEFDGDNLDTSDSSIVSDTSPTLPNGAYYPVVLMEDGPTLVYTAPISARTAITRLGPAAGSIGGNTIMRIFGSGFSEVPDKNVVVIGVPTSTTFLNGLILCDVTEASATQLTCVTRPHLATQASADDPMASRTKPLPTPPGDVQVVLCDSGLNDVLKFECWSDLENARSACEAFRCTFEYADSLTPKVHSVSPRSAAAGQEITISGERFGQVVEVQLREAISHEGPMRSEMHTDTSSRSSTSSALWATIPVTFLERSRTSITFPVPKLASCQYTVTLRKFNDELSIADSVGAGDFELPLVISSTAGSVGSREGGNPLTLSTADSSVGFNVTHPDRNVVRINSLPCDVVDVSTHHLTCLPAPMSGRVLAEYWQLTRGTYSFPAIETFTSPDISQLEDNVYKHWGSSGPGEPVDGDFFASRFTFYLQLPATQNYTFELDCDDNCALFDNGNRILGADYPNTRAVTSNFPAGQHQFVVTHVEHAGAAKVQLRWAISSSSLQDVPWHKVTPVQSGEPMAISVYVNGAEADHDCPTRQGVQVKLPASPDNTWESETVDLMGPTCSYIYSAYRTPELTMPLPDTISSASPFEVTGIFLAESMNATDYEFRMNGVLGSVDAVQGNATYPTLLVTPPPLPIGTWPVSLRVAGFGYTAPLQLNTQSRLDVRYSLTVDGPVKPAGSYWGGFEAEVLGWGFVPTDSDEYEQVMSLEATTSNNVFEATVVSASASRMVVHFRRVADFNANIQQDSPSRVVGWRVQVDNTGSRAETAQFQMEFDPTYTPIFTSAPSSLASPNTTGTSIELSWNVLAVSEFEALPVGVPSNASIELQSGPILYPCTATTVASSAVGDQYAETTTCLLPDYMPASEYTIWLTATGTSYTPGSGFAGDKLAVPLTVDSISHTTSSAAGGLTITLTGHGFSTNASEVAVTFTNSTLSYQGYVMSASETSISVRTPRVPEALEAAIPLNVMVIPTLGAPSTPTNFAVTFDTGITPRVLSVSPNRGSTAGGTIITVSIDPMGPQLDGSSSEYSVTVGDLNNGQTCSDVSISSDKTQLTCVTASPSPRVFVPQVVHVLRQEKGWAECGDISDPMDSPCRYQYIDLWSRRTTWGGNAPPRKGDSVFIPAGNTVLLDVSPPELNAVVLQGHLEFDSSATEELVLRCKFILVNGGSLSIGTAEEPFPGKARITLVGTPTSTQLPLYGAKVLALRNGTVALHGKHKTPTWTKMARTADVGDQSIEVVGDVSGTWAVDDRIAIGSSSVFGVDAEERNVSQIVYNSDRDTTTLFLSTALEYTHLGEVVTVDGDDRGHVLDMRAEVAVLTRNVVFEGDELSEKYAFGATAMIHTHGSHPRALYTGEQVEMRSVGQAFGLGRYNLHWHLHGDAEYKQYMRGCAVSQSWNRAVTIHGTHNVNITDNVAYRVMGHTFFLEDGIEEGNYITGNLGMLTYPSNALLNTDTTPAIFWITHPNNVVRNNVGSGSVQGYGFWYRFLSHPEGPSFTTSVCPKFTPLLEFKDNVAHSNMFYGLRIHPEFYPKLNPCGRNPLGGFHVDFQQVPAVFDGLVAYKNGMKGAIATQVGLIQFQNFTLADNGGGPMAHITNGKDNGANMELTWILDDRNRDEADNTSPVPSLSLDAMAGMTNSILITRTPEGNRGTAGRSWLSPRKITGVVMHSQVEFNGKHSALASLQNVTFVGYDGTDNTNGFYALEACGKCKTDQGGAFTFTKGIKFIQADALNGTKKPVALSSWSWPHQGVFLDTDGTLLNSETVPQELADSAGFPIGVPGTTWHSSIGNQLFEDMPEDCVYASPPLGSGGMFCGPHLKFRRHMLNSHQPSQLEFVPLLVTDQETNKTSKVFFTHYNDDGYQFVVPTQRDYWLHWEVLSGSTLVKVDPTQIRIHRPDLLDDSSWVYITTSNIQLQNHYVVNDRTTIAMNYTGLPDPMDENTMHGDAYYNKTFVPDTWNYGNNQYNHTLFTMVALGPDNGALRASPRFCPPDGCTNEPGEAIDKREGLLLWSQPETWSDETRFPNGKPIAGENVTIPFGWNLVIDEDTAPMEVLDIQGNVTFSRTQDITLQAKYILVTRNGYLWAGTADEPHPAGVSIKLEGTRQTPAFVITEDFNLGAKVLTAFNGGRISMHGRRVSKRWLKLDSTAEAGSNTLVLSDGDHGWSVGDRLLVASSTFNPRQAEFGTISAVSGDGRTITLEENLQFSHSAMIKEYPGTTRTLDARTEVALVTSNIEVMASDGNVTRAEGGEAFGCHVIVQGEGYASLSHISISYGGQFGKRPTVKFQSLKPVPQRNDETGEALTDSSGEVLTEPNPSSVDSSVLLYNMHGALWTESADGEPVSLTNNVVYEAFDKSAVMVSSTGNTIQGNLVINVIKQMAGKSGFDDVMVSNFEIAAQPNFVLDNVAAGSERFGFQMKGPDCDTASTLFRNNTVHSALGGLWLESLTGSSCSGIHNFTTYLHWDFGVITVQGHSGSLHFNGLVIADSKHRGLMPLIKGPTLHSYEVLVEDSLFIGESRPEVCTMCAQSGDPGCAPKLSEQSYNQGSPFGPSAGLVHGVFAMKFSPGPEPKPYDTLKGYATVSGITRVKSTTFADFKGDSGCGGGSFAMANHELAPDASHPVYLEGSNVVDVATGGLFHLVGPSPSWRNLADCGMQSFPPEGLGNEITVPGVDIDYQLDLNCAGPRHVFFRDTDGSLTGVAGSINGAYDQERLFPYDQGTPILKGPCTLSSGFGAYQCRQEDNYTFQHDPRNRPEPQPPGSYFSDPQLFVLESRDADTESRNFGPVYFGLANGTSVDLVVPAMDQGWCFAYTCQERLSTFWTYLPTFHTAIVNFTGTPPRVMRLNYPYVGPDDELVLVINMRSVPERRFVWLDEQGSAPNSYPTGRVSPLAQPPSIGDGTPHGAYYWDQLATEVWVKMKGGLHLEVRKERAISINTRLAVSVSDFFDNLQDKFLESFAFAMGIPPSRFQIVSVVPGSAVVDARAYDSEDSYGPSPDPSLNSNMTEGLDMGTTSTNFTIPSAAESSEVSKMLDGLSKSVQSGMLETQLGMRIEGLQVSANDTDVESDETQNIVDAINEAGSEEGISSSRYSGQKWNLIMEVSVDVDYDDVMNSTASEVEFKTTMREALAMGLFNISSALMGSPLNKSEPCVPCIMIGELLRGSVKTTMTTNLADDLTEEQFQSFQQQVEASSPTELFALPEDSPLAGKISVGSTGGEEQGGGSDPAPGVDPTPAPEPSDGIGLEPEDPPPSRQSSDDDDEAGKIAGGVVGGVVGFLVVIVLPIFLFFYIRKRKNSGEGPETEKPTHSSKPSFIGHAAVSPNNDIPMAERKFSNINNMLTLQQQQEQQQREQEEMDREQQQKQEEHQRKMAFAAHPSSPARASAELRSSFREVAEQRPEDAPEGYPPLPVAVTLPHHPHLDPLFHRGRLPTVAPPKLQPPFRPAHPTSSHPGIFFDDDEGSPNMGAHASPLGPGTFPAGADAGGHLNPGPRPTRFSPRTEAAATLAEAKDEMRVTRSDRTFGLPGSLDTQLSKRTTERMAGGAYLSVDGTVLPDSTASPSSRPPAEAEDGSIPPAHVSPPRHLLD